MLIPLEAHMSMNNLVRPFRKRFGAPLSASRALPTALASQLTRPEPQGGTMCEHGNVNPLEWLGTCWFFILKGKQVYKHFIGKHLRGMECLEGHLPPQP